MKRLALLAVWAAACGAPPSPSGSVDDPVIDRVEPFQCAPEVLCFAGCSVAFPGCLKGTLDVDECVCRNSSGQALTWPDSEATPESMSFDTPVPAAMEPGTTISLAVTVRFSDGTRRSATKEASFSASPSTALTMVSPGVAKVDGYGPLTLTASWEGLSVTATTFRPVEARAVWVTRFDWVTEADVRRVVASAADAGFNVVFFQVRGTADAYYNSTFEPWAARFGKNPGWDPLQVAIDTAHARGIELHAYMNAFTGWVGTATPPASPAGEPTHVVRLHPEWVEKTQDGLVIIDPKIENYQWLSPGIEAVREWNTNVVKDLVTNYNVDGVHLDRIRYAGSSFGWNALSRQAFEDSDFTNFNEFRTHAVNDQVRRIYEMLQTERPDVRLTAAVWGIHTRLPGCPGTSQGHSDYFQDSWAWAQGGYIDALVPMIYWEEDFGTDGCTQWSALYQTFLDHRGSAQVWGGMNVLDKDPLDTKKEIFDWDKLSLRIETAREMNAPGVALYASGQLDDNDAWTMLSDGPFESPSSVPPLR